ncbi:MAG TPA: LacI family DNA-binding transcriptional regulator [Armatimonadota bacterium]|nr:LacI family DNA-binding transcriptional regulator [Armatimonadota bacterium]
MGRVTQKQIAIHAGVCQPTVSQVLSGRGVANIPSATSERILRIAQELGYRRVIPTGNDRRQTKNIGFLIPETMTSEGLIIYVTQLYRGVCAELDEHGYHLHQAIIRPNDCFPELVAQGKVDGVILANECSEELIAHIRERVPVVLLNYHVPYSPIDAVMPDNTAGIAIALKHLYLQGHRSIGLFGFEPYHHHHAERIDAYRDVMAQYGLPITDGHIAARDPQQLGDIEEVDQYARETLQRWHRLVQPVTAAICLADLYASSLLRAAYELGIAVPEQFSVVGFDNVPICEHTLPRLTTIEQPLELMGQTACSLLLQRIAHGDRPFVKIRLGVKFIERESTGPVCMEARETMPIHRQ